MKPALLLIDLQDGFLARPGMTPPAATLVPTVAGLLEECRGRGVPILHVRTVGPRDGGPPNMTLASTRDGEPVFTKRFYSAFGNADLDDALRRLGVDTLVLAGVFEHACVRATALDAHARGYEVRIASDATASTEPLHAEVSRTWLAARAAKYFRAGEVLGPPGEEDRRVEVAVRAAVTAQAEWAARPVGWRIEVLSAWADRLERGERELGLLMAEEIGKPVAEGRAEVRRGVALVRAAARLAGAEPPCISEGVHARRRPVGVVALVTPWNNPIGIPAGKIAPALAFGNAVVLKPAPEAPATTAALRETLLEAGAEEGLLQVVPGDAETAREIMAAAGVAAVSFTGSSAAGRRVAAVCARAGKPLQAELGGNNPAIVMADASVAALAPDLALAAFGFAGQRCTALRRFLVEERIRDEFEQAFVSAATSLRVGDPMVEATQVGPLISVRHRDRVHAAVEAALRSGARLLCGGRGDGAFYEPTVLRCDDPAAAIVREETFGPVAVILGVADFEEALRLANDTSYGLVAALYGHDEEVGRRFVDSVQAGIVRLNSPPSRIHPEAPFGGVKASGLGPPEHGVWDAEFYSRPQVVYT